jgi:hypothetical protein
VHRALVEGAHDVPAKKERRATVDSELTEQERKIIERIARREAITDISLVVLLILAVIVVIAVIVEVL